MAQEEIDELDKLIDDTKLLLEKYPDKFSLKMSLRSLEARKEILIMNQ